MNISITAIIVFLGLIVLFKFFSKIAMKVLGFVLIIALAIGVMYYQSWGPFKNNMADIGQLEQKYCGIEGDEDICDCIIIPAKEDMSNRFSPAEIAKLEAERLKAVYVLKKSLDATKASAMACLTAKGQAEKYKTFVQDFIPVENEYLDLIGEKARNVSDKVKDEVQKFRDNKDSIDNKY